MYGRKRQIPRHRGEQILGGRALVGAATGGLKNLAGQLFDGKKGVDFGQVGKAALGGAAGSIPIVGGAIQNAITGGGAQGGGAQQQPQNAQAPTAPGAVGPGGFGGMFGQGGGQGLMNLAQNAFGMDAGGTTRGVRVMRAGGRPIYAEGGVANPGGPGDTGGNPYTEGSPSYKAYEDAMRALSQSNLSGLQGKTKAYRPAYALGSYHAGGFDSPTYDLTQEAAAARAKELGYPGAGQFFDSPEEFRKSALYKETTIPFDQIIGGTQPGKAEDYEPYGEGTLLYSDYPQQFEPANAAALLFQKEFEKSLKASGGKYNEDVFQDMMRETFGTYDSRFGGGDTRSSSAFSRGELDFGRFGEASGEQSVGGRAPYGRPSGVRLMKRGGRR